MSDTVLLPLCDLRGLEVGNELPTELVTVIEEAQDVHGALLGGEGFCCDAVYPALLSLKRSAALSLVSCCDTLSGYVELTFL
jgi:hypothetical protein